MAMSKITQNDKELIYKLYNDGYGTLKLAEMFSVNRMTMQRHLKKLGLNLRRTSPHSVYNVNYFNIQLNGYSRENCYWAGFILADGCIRSDRDTVIIHLAAQDFEHIIKFQEAIGYRGGHPWFDKHSNAYAASVSGKWFPKDLYQYFGLTPQKSLTVTFPTDVPKEQWKHLIRGIYDGDGGLTFTSCPTISFTGTDDILNAIREIFYYLIDIRLHSKNKYPPIMRTQKDTKNFGQISYSGENALKILKWMYEDSNESIRLTRKFELFKELFNE